MFDVDTIMRNFTHVTFSGVDLYFSYKTLIAFSAKGRTVVHQNDWSNTTGKHLKYIDGASKVAKGDRLDSEGFKDKWHELAEPMFQAMQISNNCCGGFLGDMTALRTRRRRIGKRR